MTCPTRNELTTDLLEIVGDGSMGSRATHDGGGDSADLLAILQGDGAAVCSRFWDIYGS
jgi:hypothetical protein